MGILSKYHPLILYIYIYIYTTPPPPPFYQSMKFLPPPIQLSTTEYLNKFEVNQLDNVLTMHAGFKKQMKYTFFYYSTTLIFLNKKPVYKKLGLQRAKN